MRPVLFPKAGNEGSEWLTCPLSLSVNGQKQDSNPSLLASVYSLCHGEFLPPMTQIAEQITES